MWGNSTTHINGSEYLRNERNLYGLEGEYVSTNQTSEGEPRVRVQAYAAQPDQLPGRDVFVGTGGSLYFLQRQDIAAASETVSVEMRDPDTGRVISRRTLAHGRDYSVNISKVW